MIARVFLVALIALSAACAGGNGVRRPTGGLTLRCTPTDATVYVDDAYRGSCAVFARRPLALEPGNHRLQVDASGHFPYYGEVDTGRTVRTFEVELVARPE